MFLSTILRLQNNNFCRWPFFINNKYQWWHRNILKYAGIFQNVPRKKHSAKISRPPLLSETFNSFQFLSLVHKQMHFAPCFSSITLQLLHTKTALGISMECYTTIKTYWDYFSTYKNRQIFLAISQVLARVLIGIHQERIVSTWPMEYCKWVLTNNEAFLSCCASVVQASYWASRQ